MNSRSKTFLNEIHQFSHGKNGCGPKAMFPILDHRANILSISEAPMEHNISAKSKETFLFNLFLLKYDPKILLYENVLHTPLHGEFF